MYDEWRVSTNSRQDNLQVAENKRASWERYEDSDDVCSKVASSPLGA